MKPTRSVPKSVAQRLDAAIAATRIAREFVEYPFWNAMGPAPWTLVAKLYFEPIDKPGIRILLDKMLDIVDARPHWIALLRLRVAEIEIALGLPCDPRSEAARNAYTDGELFSAYCASLERAFAEKISIPVRGAA